MTIYVCIYSGLPIYLWDDRIAAIPRNRLNNEAIDATRSEIVTLSRGHFFSVSDFKSGYVN